MKNGLDIRKYQSAAAFLHDYYTIRKKQDTDFSYARWAQELGLKTRAYLPLMLQGERPISEKMMYLFADFFAFDQHETDYFIALVNYNQSKNIEQRRLFGKKVLLHQMEAENFQEVENHYDFLANPLLPRLQTLLSFGDFSRHPSEAAKILNITENEFKAACEQLARLSLVEAEKTSENFPDWKVKKRSWRLPNNFKDLGYREFYLETFSRAKQAIDLFDNAERRFRSLFMAMTQDEFQDFLKDFESFVKEQCAKRDVDSFVGRRLYQLTFAFFPSSEPMRGPADDN